MPNYYLMTEADLNAFLTVLERHKLDYYHNPTEKERISQIQQEVIHGWYQAHYPSTN
jgi:hypothetical protein